MHIFIINIYSFDTIFIVLLFYIQNSSIDVYVIYKIQDIRKKEERFGDKENCEIVKVRYP